MSFFKKQPAYINADGDPVMKRSLPKIVPILAAAVLVLVFASSCFTVITAGHTGVVSTFGKVSESVLQEGFHLKAPWQSVTKMDNRIVKLEVSTEAFSSDLQTVNVNLAVNYRVDTSKSYSIVKNVGTQYEDVLITIQASCGINPYGVTVEEEDYPIRVGEMAYLRGDGYMGSGMVEAIEIIETFEEEGK